MAVIRSLKRTPSLLLEQPIVLVPVLVIALLQTPQLFAQSMDPLVSLGISAGFTVFSLFVMPFFFGGLIGMANDMAASERTSLGRFVRYGKDNYASVFGAYLVLFGISIVFSIVVVIAVFLGLVGAVAAGGGALALGAIGIGYLVLFVLFLAVVAVFQFYGHAIVIDGERAFDSLKRSAGVVKANLRQVIGYYAILTVAGLVMGGLYVAIVFWAFPMGTAGEPAPAPDLGTALIAAGGSALIWTAFGGLFLLYSVVFYRSVTGLDESNEPSSATSVRT